VTRTKSIQWLAQKERIQQPEVYIRDLLQEIALKIERGPYAGLYSLLPAFKGTRPEGQASTSGAADEDEDEDEDMDAVAS
jgi:hypothetical protein